MRQLLHGAAGSTRPWLAVLVAGLLAAASARADVQGGIEIGAKGVRVVAVETKAGQDLKVLMSGTQNTTLVGGLAKTGRFSPDALKETAAAVARFAEKLRKEHLLPDSRIHVVGSSGLFSALAGKDDLIRENRAALVAAVRESAKLPLAFLDVTREAELSILSVVPLKHADTAVLLDIGSGNTKGGALDKSGRCITFGIPFGTVTFADAVRAKSGKGDFAAAASALRGQLLTPAVKDQLRTQKGLAGRPRIYLGGGTVWALATLMRPQDRSSAVALSARDISAFHELLVKNEAAVPAPDLSKIADTTVRQRARKEVEQVRKTFTREQLLAGTEILRALGEGFDFAAPDRQLVFARNGYLGWIIGYVAEKARAPR